LGSCKTETFPGGRTRTAQMWWLLVRHAGVPRIRALSKKQRGGGTF